MHCNPEDVLRMENAFHHFAMRSYTSCSYSQFRLAKLLLSDAKSLRVPLLARLDHDQAPDVDPHVVLGLFASERG